MAEVAAAPPVYVLYVFGVCVLAGIVRLLSRWTVVHHTVIMFALGALFGYLAYRFNDVNLYVNVDFLSSARLLQVHTLLLPVVILEYLFSIDPRVFLSCKPAAVMTVVLDYLLTLFFQGAFVFFFLDFYNVPWTPTKTVLIYLLVGSLTSVTDTSYVVNTFYKMGSYWVLLKLMEIKRVISLVGACVIYIFVVYANEFNYEIGWYNVFIFLVFQFLACPALGWLTAQLVIFWLGRLYNDICVEITVSIAVAYLLYYFGTVNISHKPMVSAIGVVVYALLLNNRRTCFSLGLDTFLHKLIRILAYVVKTVIFTIVGFLLTHEEFSEHEDDVLYIVPNVLVSCTLYSWCMLSRGFVCALLAPVLRRCGYKLSWQELSTMVFCNVTGTVCLITAVASFNINLVELFFNDRRIQYTLMFHLSMLAIIRSLVAGTLFRHVLTVLGMTHVSLGRYVAMNNALQKVQEQITTSARSYKFDRFLADADWETVYGFTNFDNPYKDISRYSVIGRAMNVDSELLGDTRLNLLLISKMSFWRQYEQGLLSLRALRILLEECYLAEWKVTTSSYDIGDQIRKHYETKGKGMFNVIQTLKLKFERMQEIRSLIIDEIVNTAKDGTWKKLIFKIGLHMSLEIVFILIALFISIASILILVYESNCSQAWPPILLHILYYELNFAFMLIITVYITLKLYIFKSRYLVLFGSYFNMSLIIVGWIDVGLHGIVLLSPPDTCALLIRTQWAIDVRLVLHKFFLVYRCLRLFILLQDKTYIIVRTMKKRMLLQLQLGYDVGKAYVYCKEDLRKTAGEFIAQSATLDDIQREVQSSRVQLMRELATVQKKYPGIVVSVKSQEACRRILNVAKETVNQLQRNGRVDAYEADMLDEMIKLRLKRLNKIPAQIEMPSVETLISKLSWVNGDETLMRLLHFNSKLFNMAEGESVDFDSDPTAGLYILVSGLIRVNWSIGEPYGKLLQSSHTSSETSLHSTSKMQLHDYMTTGSTFGELALLTETPIAIDAVCETSVLMYHVQYESIQTALKWVTEPSLEWRLWLISAVRLSIPLLKALPGYYNSSLEDLKIITDYGTLIVKRLESQSQDDSNEERFSLARYTNSSHVILVHGTAKKSRETFIGPIIIPPDNDDLVFSYMFCDVYVLYIVPHRTAGTSVGFAYSVSASEVSAVVEVSKETAGQMPVTRTGVPKKRGRRVSVGATPGLKLLDRTLSSSPLRFVSENTSAEKESMIESSVTREGLQEIGETPEDLTTTTASPLFFIPQTVKPELTTRSVSDSPQILRPYEKTEPMDEEVAVSLPKSVAIDRQTAQEKPEETEVEKAPATLDELTPVETVPQRSSSEIFRRKSEWREAWTHVMPEIKLTIGKEKSSTPQIPTASAGTSVAGVRGAATSTVGTAAGKENAGTPPSSTRKDRKVTDTSTSEPTTDVNKKNENASNSNVNNSSNNNILHQYPCEIDPRTSMPPTRNKGTFTTVVSVPHWSRTPDQVSRSSIFRLGEESKDRTAVEDSDASKASNSVLLDAASAKSSEYIGMIYEPGDEVSDYTSSIEDDVAPELNQSVDIHASKLPTTGKSDDRDDSNIGSELSLLVIPAVKAISPTIRDRDGWTSSLQEQPPTVTPSSAAWPIDVNEDNLTVHVGLSDESQTIYYRGSRTSKALTENVLTETERAGVALTADGVPGRDAKDAALFTSQSMRDRHRAAKAASSKLAASKIPHIIASKPTGSTAAKRPENAKPSQPTKTVAKSPDGTRNARATTSSQRVSRDCKPAMNSAASFAASSNTAHTVEKLSQCVTRDEHLRTPSTSGSSIDDGPVAQRRNRTLRRGNSSAAKPVTKPDTREKKSPTTGMRTSRAPADSTRPKIVDDNHVDST